RLIAWIDLAERHDLQAVRLDGLQAAVGLLGNHARVGHGGDGRSEDVGVEQPTSAPAMRSAAARFTATVDLPTPPLPDATAIVCLTPGRISDGFGRMNAGRTLAVMRTSTAVTPGSPPTAS